MASKRTLKRVPKTVSADTKELRKIERLLGEDFDTLAQARRALKRESKPVSEKAFQNAKTRADEASFKVPKLPVKKSYTVRELNGNQRRALTTLLSDKKTADEINAQLLKPGENWGATIQYDYTGRDLETHKGQARTYQLYGRLDQLFNKITGYIEHGLKQKLSQRKIDDFLKNIKIIRWGKAAPPKADKKKIDAIQRENRLEWRALKQEEKAKGKARKVALRQRLKKSDARARKAEKELAQLKAANKAKKGKRK